MHLRFLIGSLVVALAQPATAGELRIYPDQFTLSPRQPRIQLLVVEQHNGRVMRDHPVAEYQSSAKAVARVTPKGEVIATGNGEATITARVAGSTATTRLIVEGLEKPVTWSFQNHVVPVLTRAGCNSGACHGALAGKGGLKLSLRGFDIESDWFVLTRQALGRRIDPNNPAASLMLRKAARQIPHGGGARISEGDEHHTMLLEWIQAGAPGPQTGTPELQTLEVFPQAALLKTKDTLRLKTIAIYSDGTRRDVTDLAKYQSSEELVASVSEDALATVVGNGEASIIVNFGSRVASATLTSPFTGTFDPALWKQSPRNNFVDDHILKKLELLRIPPSPNGSDTEFIRRIYLDMCGIIPPLDDVAKFLANPDTKKREQLVEELLKHPAFVDYWAYRWSELFLVSSRKLPQSAMWAFYQKLRQSVADNQPWDRLAREILTASGSSLRSGGGNFYLLHKDVSDLAETTAITFLGTSLGCAKCHNHPLEKWTQDQYWAFANLFSRVSLKNGDRPGEVFVQSRLDGDALHLRRGIALPPTPLDGLPLALGSTQDRRSYLADWITAPENPYFARAIVNRVWRNYMGRGLVEAEDDLRVSNPPSNGALLDALAEDFIKHNYDLKHLMRTIVRSAAYQRSATPLATNAADDRFYSHYLVRRLSAEVILDAYSDFTQVPTPFVKLQSAAGDSATPTSQYPSGTRAIQLPDSLLQSRFLEAFGRAERVATCACERTTDASVGQALHLNNGETLNQKLRSASSIISKWVAADGLSNAEIVERVYQLALTRSPNANERKRMLAILDEAGQADPKLRREVVEDFVWAVLTGREFLFNR